MCSIQLCRLHSGSQTNSATDTMNSRPMSDVLGSMWHVETPSSLSLLPLIRKMQAKYEVSIVFRKWLKKIMPRSRHICEGWCCTVAC